MEERSGRLAWNSHESCLDDTLARLVFERSRRDCIRVQEPEKLAAWGLRNQREWTPACIDNAMGEGPAGPAPSDPRAMANLPRS
jgi:murein L,D-transpeptidase YcbB/YkuD